MEKIKLNQTHRYDFIDGYHYTVAKYRRKYGYVYCGKERVIFADDNQVQYSLFQIIKDNIGLDWFDDKIVEALELEYYLLHSGEKYISILFYKLLEMYNAYDLSFCNYFINVNKKVYDKLSNLIISKYKDNWNKIYNAYYLSQYNPIHNYDMNETKKINSKTIKTNISAEKNNIVGNSNINNKNNIYGYNSSSSQPTDENTQVNDYSSDNNITSNNQETTSQDSDANFINLKRNGNIGVTTSQKMLKEELELRNYNIIEKIMNDIDKILCSQLY